MNIQNLCLGISASIDDFVLDQYGFLHHNVQKMYGRSILDTNIVLFFNFRTTFTDKGMFNSNSFQPVQNNGEGISNKVKDFMTNNIKRQIT